MKTRRHRAIQKAQLPEERVGKIVDELNNVPLEPIKIDMNSTVRIIDTTTNEVIMEATALTDIHETDLIRGSKEEVKSPYTEYVEEVLEKTEKESAVTKAKNFLKGIFKR